MADGRENENGRDDRMTKVFNDPIHGHIEFHSLCVRIIDTPQFQRLRNIKQLGPAYLVFPGASHNRFEHSLGVGYLAGVFVKTLRKRQPELKITDKDELCVVIAGLCHDLGHGPFSHVFEKRFIRQAPKSNQGQSNVNSAGNSSDWKHEKASAEMFDHLMEANNLKEIFKAYKFYDVPLNDPPYSFDDKDFDFIKAMIRGSLENNDVWEGRDESKSFLYEIVANKHSGIDVDKFDYFARDCHHLGMRSIFDHQRFMEFVRVIEHDGLSHICCRDKELGNVYDLFYVRNMLHRRAYQHKNCVIIDYMLTEALLEANEHLKYPGKDGKLLKLSETIHDMQAYTLVHDEVFHRIRQSKDAALERARKILGKIETRKLYKCVGQYRERQSNKLEAEIRKALLEQIKNKIELPVSGVAVQKDESEVRKEILEQIQNIIELYDEKLQDEICEEIVNQSKNPSELRKSDVIVQFCKYDYGKGKENPVSYVLFYSKRNEKAALKYNRDQSSEMSPQIFHEVYVRVYSRKPKKDKLVKECFIDFCDKKGYTPYVGGDTQSMEILTLPVQATDDQQSIASDISESSSTSSSQQ